MNSPDPMPAGPDPTAPAAHGVQTRRRPRPGERREQVGNVAQSTVLQDAWARGQHVTVHGWVYGLKDGLVKDLKVSMDCPETIVEVFRTAIKRYPRAGTGLALSADED